MSGCTVGIDGGGSNLRVAVVDAEMRVLAQVTRGTANPSGIGREAAAGLIQAALREVVAQAGQPIAAVGIGVAGASAAHAGEWLRATVGAVLPGIPVAASMDHEIALVGANGERRGVLILAGTGSVAYGVNAAGESAQAGGWGYLLGDEGGGYWMGVEALRAVTRAADAGQAVTEGLAGRALAAIERTEPKEVIGWLYRTPPPIREVAALAGLVLDQAAEGDPQAAEIVARAAEALAGLVETIQRRLGMTQPRMAFAGGLLTAENPLSWALCERLGLVAIPSPRYPPVVGAALLARLMLSESRDG